MVKVGIIGATGYAGNELVRLLMGHKDVEIMWYGSRSYIDKKYAEVYQNMFEIVEDTCLDDNMEELASKVDVIFTATPQGFLAGVLTEEILSRVKIIDLSADFRIKDVKTYEKWYKIEHKSPQFIEEAVYGLCEINRDKVKGARLIANPGCYTTCSILTAYPLVKEGLIDTTQLVTLSGSKYDEAIEAAAGMVISAGYTPSGIAMDPTLSFGLSTMRDTTGRKIYPEIGFGQNVTNFLGMNAAISDTVSAKNEISKATNLLGIVGQFDAFRWGVQRSIGAHLIEYGDPDGLGDLQRNNQIAIRAEIVYGIGIMDQNAFVKIDKAGE